MKKKRLPNEWDERRVKKLISELDTQTAEQSIVVDVEKILGRSRQQFRDGKWLSEDEFWSQFEHAQAPRSATKRKKRP